MGKAPLPVNEEDRLRSLVAARILDTPPDKILDRITHLTALICDVPIALVSLVDKDRQWFKAKVGIEASETSRDVAFCAHAILGEDILEVDNALEDQRFAKNPLVLDQPNIRFYAGYPLTAQDGHRYGTLCVIDQAAKKLTAQQRQSLKILGQQVVDHIALMKYQKELEEQRDISDRVIESQLIFRTITETTPVLICLEDEKKDQQYANKSWCNYFGEGSEYINQAWPGIHPEDVKQFLSLRQTAWEKQTSYKIDLRVQVRGNEYRWLTGQGFPYYDLRNRFHGFVSTFSDVTDLRRNEDLVQESRNFLDTVVNNLPFGIYCKDLQKEYSYSIWNRFLEDTFHLKRTQVLGRNDFSLWTRDQAEIMRKEDGALIQSATQRMDREELLELKPGAKQWLHTTKLILKDSHGKSRYLLGIYKDITEAKQQQAQMIVAAKMSSLGEMASGMAHEINNPLAIISGKAEHLIRIVNENKLDTKILSEGLGKIFSTAQRIAKIVKGLRSFSRQGEHDEYLPVPLSQIISDTLEVCQQRFKSRNIEVKIHGDQTVSIECRAVQIAQVLLNLLNNSFDAIVDSKTPWIHLQIIEEAEVVNLRVIDSGEGISSAVAEKLMQPFFTTKEVGKGTGLGLSISKGIVENHGGSFTYDSLSPNTCFVIRLPKKQK